MLDPGAILVTIRKSETSIIALTSQAKVVRHSALVKNSKTGAYVRC